MKKVLIFEFFSEEMPASLIETGAHLIANIFKKELESKSITFDNFTFYFSPTRLVYLAENVRLVLDKKANYKGYCFPERDLATALWQDYIDRTHSYTRLKPLLI